MSLKSALVAAVAMLAIVPLSANAHMIMASPVPFGNPNNSPLDASGSDFPCKSVEYTVKTMNDWKVGSTQTLSFTGTAVHGGGSCQMSVTTDKEPTKDSKWKVIYSIEGGCPAAAAGNLDQSGPSTDSSFQFTIPSELPNGVMTTAWTWFNKIGNREMYMNCAPITVSGGSDDTAAFEALPDMAVANIGVSTSCGTTSESSDFTFQNAGKYVNSAGKGPFVELCSDKASQPNTGGGGSGNADLVPAPSAPSSASPPPAPSASQPAATPSSAADTETTFRTIKTVTASMPLLPSKTGGACTPGSKSAAASAPAPDLQSTGQSSASPVAPQPQPSASPQPQSSAAPAPADPVGNGESCPTDGAVVCSADGSQFGICNFGKAVMMSVASGTKCVNGAIAKRGDYSHRNQRTAV